MIAIIAVAAVVSTFLGGYFAIRLQDKLHLVLGFSAGAVIGVAFFDLLPESISLGSIQYNVSLITLLIAAGFSLLMVIDRLFSIHPHDEEECDKPNHQGMVAASALVFHSLLDGVAIGLAFKVSSAVGWVVTAAVLAHDFSDGINSVSLILKGRGGNKRAYGWLIADSLAPAIGIIISSFFVVSESNLGLILAVFTGFFLYIGASDLIPESHHHHPTFLTTFMTLLGIVVLYFVVRFAG
jgi:zinc transporter ZupT